MSRQVKIRLTEEQYQELLLEAEVEGYKNLQTYLLSLVGVTPRKKGRPPINR